MASANDALTKEEHARILREQIFPQYNLDSLASHEKPVAVILGGQPGSGKGGLSRAASAELGRDVITVDPDELRDFHPNVDNFRRENPLTWSGRTHADAGAWADELLEASVSERKNLIFDTTLSNGQWASESLIKDLQSKGYQVEVRVVATPLLESELGVDRRFTDRLDAEGYGRHVPKGARDAIYNKIPASLDTIHAGSDVVIRIFNREGKELYDSRIDPRQPGQALDEERNARLRDPEVSQRLRGEWARQAEWHRDLPEHAKDIPGMDAGTRGRLLREQADANSVQFAALRAEGSATIDELVRPGAPPARAPVIDPEIPGLRRAGAAAGMAGLGLLASAYDAHETGQRVGELLQEQNAAAAGSELKHFAARGVGGWTGGALAASLVGSTGAGPLALVAADAYLFSKAFEKAATLHDSNAVYHQRDKAGVDWEFNGRNWVREASLDRTQDGVNNPVKHDVSANYEKARELGAYASAAAVEQALGKVSAPQDPFNIPARPGDQRGLDNQNWQRDAQSEQWVRQVKTGVEGANDRSIYASEMATPSRSRELDQEAIRRIESNIADGREAVAAAYLQTHAVLRSQDFIDAIPPAVEYAKAEPDAVLGSDRILHRRNAAGQWLHEGVVASGNLALELELTRQLRQPWLERANETLAELQTRPAPSPAEMERNELLHRYQTYGVRVPEDWVPAIELATQRSRDSHGVTGATLQELERGEMGLFGADSGIVHYQTGPDGIAHKVATTSPDEIRHAHSELAQRVDRPPVPDSPELRITALSAQERDAHEQALREANREGLSIGEAQQVAAAAALGIADQRIEEALAPEAQQRESGPVEATVPPAMAAAPIPPISAPLPKEPDRAQPSEMDRHDEARRTEAERAQASRETEESDLRQAVDTADEVVRQVPQAQTNHPETAEAPPMSPTGSSAPDAMNLQPAHVEPGAAVPAAHEPQRGSEPEAVTIANTHQLPPQITEPQPIADQLASDWQPANEDSREQMQSLAEEAIPLHHFTQPSTEAELEQTAQPPVSNREESYAQDALLRQAEQAGQPISSETEREELADIPPAEPLDVARLPEQQHAAPAKLSPAHPDHPDNRLYEQIREGVAELDAQHGRTPDAMSERLTGSLLVLAKDNGLDRVDHVVLSQATADARSGQNVFVVQGEMGDPAQLRAGMSTQQAVTTPLEESMQQFDAVAEERQTRAQQQALQQQDEDQRVQHEMQMTAASMGG
ncbi:MULTISPECIES: zeta toxin family protein [unclassified Stenotrophomonas]|uniref:zeta toxin family protein n=1 Tax=unclassified Stenotrophomonas TaxID=196198 RepID=UPI0021191AFE|nr:MULTISPECIES: zeta toxin family protein [unclassified Stenotrophomonas]